MKEIVNLILSLSQEIKDLKARIELIRQSRAERLKNTWIDNQDVLQTLHISKRIRHFTVVPRALLRRPRAEDVARAADAECARADAGVAPEPGRLA